MEPPISVTLATKAVRYGVEQMKVGLARPGIWWICWFFRRFTRPGKQSGKQSHNYGQSPFLMGNSTISTGPFSIAMLVYQRVSKLILVSSKGHTRFAWLMIDKRTTYTDVHMFYSKALWFHSIIVVWDFHYLSCSFLFAISCVLKCYMFFQIHATIALYSLCLDHLGVNWLKSPQLLPGRTGAAEAQWLPETCEEACGSSAGIDDRWVFCSCIYIYYNIFFMFILTIQV